MEEAKISSSQMGLDKKNIMIISGFSKVKLNKIHTLVRFVSPEPADSNGSGTAFIKIIH